MAGEENACFLENTTLRLMFISWEVRAPGAKTLTIRYAQDKNEQLEKRRFFYCRQGFLILDLIVTCGYLLIRRKSKTLHIHLVFKAVIKYIHYFLPFFVWITVWIFLFLNGKLFSFNYLISFLIFVIGYPFWAIAMKGRKLVKKNIALGAEKLLKEDQRLHVLYLRSFKDDAIAGKSARIGLTQWDVNTEEENITVALNEIGPVIAVGQPHEELPELGAARMYLDSDWITKVTQLMKSAQLVVFRAGVTEGLVTELEAAIKSISLERIIFLTPKDEKSYNEFCYITSRYFPFALPKFVKPKSISGNLGGIIFLNPSGNFDLTLLKNNIFRNSLKGRVISARLKLAMKPVYQRLNLEWTPPPLNLKLIFILSIFLFFILSIFAIIIGVIFE